MGGHYYFALKNIAVTIFGWILLRHGHYYRYYGSNVVYIVFLVFTIKVIFNLLWLCYTLKLEIPATRWMMCEVSLLVIVVTK